MKVIEEPSESDNCFGWYQPLAGPVLPKYEAEAVELSGGVRDVEMFGRSDDVAVRMMFNI